MNSDQYDEALASIVESAERSAAALSGIGVLLERLVIVLEKVGPHVMFIPPLLMRSAAALESMAKEPNEITIEPVQTVSRHGVYTFPDGTVWDSGSNVSTRLDGSTFVGQPDGRASAP
jgi:hypothetical protein